MKGLSQAIDLIISADTIVVADGKIFEKPGTKEEAISMLAQLSGKQHEVHTVVCLLLPSKKGESPWIHSFVETTQVTFSELSQPVILSYVETGVPMDKAGGYGIQDPSGGGGFISKISGCYYNVTGFPLNRFCHEIEKIVQEGRL